MPINALFNNGLDRIDMSAQEPIDIRNQANPKAFVVEPSLIGNVEAVISPHTIGRRVSALAEHIVNHSIIPSLDRHSNIPLFVGILDASFIFLADLIREITDLKNLPYATEFIRAKSYAGEERQELEVEEITFDIRDRLVIVVDTIMDSGITLASVVESLMKKADKLTLPPTIQSAVLLSKPDKWAVSSMPTYTGFWVSDKFLIGYGLDNNHTSRGLPFIGYDLECNLTGEVTELEPESEETDAVSAEGES